MADRIHTLAVVFLSRLHALLQLGFLTLPKRAIISSDMRGERNLGMPLYVLWLEKEFRLQPNSRLNPMF